MRVRPETSADFVRIHAMTVAAFATVAYGDGSEGRIIDALRAAGALTLSLVAEDHGGIVGQISFSPVLIDGIAGPWFALGPVSVDPGRQGEGIGAVLIRQGLSILAAQGAQLCVLLGKPAYYARFGFAHDPGLTCDEGHPEAFQRLILSGEAPRGKVTFHPAFAVG